MISDDGPSGYNSGEQYDTLSAGYMSDMAGRITDTDTRMDWRETNLDVIEEVKFLFLFVKILRNWPPKISHPPNFQPKN